MPELEGYDMLSLIGRGGNGHVWRARQRGTGRDAAVKLLHFQVPSGRMWDRFALEVEVTARLDHPNIARLYESRLHAGQCAYAMEYIDGAQLDEWLRARNLGLVERLKLFVTICRAVQHAHQRGIIHRDLKPGNIMVNAAGVPKVLDFGLAKIMANSELRARRGDVTQDGAVVGTPLYMAPEQLRGDVDRLDTRTDVYALGVILYGVVVGEHPYEITGGLADIMTQVLEHDPRRPRAVDPGIHRDLEAVILRALGREPEERYAGAGALADDVQRFLDGEPVQAQVQSLVYIVRRKLAKHRGKVALAALALVAMVTVAIAAYVAIMRERDTARVAEQRAEQRLQEARRFVHTLVQDMEGALTRGPTAARKTLLRTVRGHLDALYSGIQERPELLGDRADIIARIAHVQMALLDGNTKNDLSDALAGYDRAHQLYRRAENLDPRAVTPMQWAYVLGKRAVARGQNSDLSGMEADARQAMALLQEIVNADSANAEQARVQWFEVALAWRKHLLHTDQWDAAHKIRQRMQAVSAALERTRLDDAMTWTLARVQSIRAWQLGNAGELDEALAAIERGLALIAMRPPWEQSPATRKQAAVLHEYAAWVLQSLRDLQSGLERAQRSNRAFEGLWAGDPENRDLQNWVAWSGLRVTDLQMALDEVRAAEQSGAQTVRLYAAMSATRDLRTIRDAAVAHVTLADVLLERGLLNRAGEQLRAARALLDHESMGADESMLATDRRMRLLSAESWLYQWQGRQAESDRARKEALALSAASEQGDFPFWHFDLLLAHAEVLLARGDRPASLAALDEARAVLARSKRDRDERGASFRLWKGASLDHLRARASGHDDPDGARSLLHAVLRRLDGDGVHLDADATERAGLTRELNEIRVRVGLELAELEARERRYRAARSQLARALSDIEDLTRRWPDHWKLRLLQGRAWMLEARLHRAAGRANASRDSLQRAAVAFDHILSLDGDNAEAQRARASLPSRQRTDKELLPTLPSRATSQAPSVTPSSDPTDVPRSAATSSSNPADIPRSSSDIRRRPD